MNNLIQPSEERALFDKLFEYYKRLYPGIIFRKEETVLSPEEIGEIVYTYPGAESEANFNEEVVLIEDSMRYGYDTPLIALKKGKTLFLLDGHRRAKVAFSKNHSWKVLLIISSKEVEFGIEKMAMGRVKDIFGGKK